MSPFLQLVFVLVILITVAKVSGYISVRLGQPAVLGELLAGVILGPSLLDILHWSQFTDTHLGETISQWAELGVLLLMFLAGLDLHISDLVRSGRVSVLAGTLGVFFPVVMGCGLGLLFGFDFLPALFLGLILAATSVSISAQTLMEMRVLRSRVGTSLLGAAVFDDVLVVLGLSVVIAIAAPAGEAGSVLWMITRMVLFLGGGLLLGMLLLPRIVRSVDRLPISQGLVAFSFVLMLLYAWSAEVLGGMADITGAFIAGLALGRSPLKDRIQTGFSTLAYGVFVPIFFVNVGLHANIYDMGGENLTLAFGLIVVAIVSKIFGAGLGARLAGMSNRESLQLGVGMMSRGEVGLIVASLGVTQGLLAQDAFSGVVGVVLITTLLTPPMLRILFNVQKKKEPVSAARKPTPVQPQPVPGPQSTPKEEG